MPLKVWPNTAIGCNHQSKLNLKGDTLLVMAFHFYFLGVYRAGFAQSQESYDKAVREVFAGLDKVEAILSNRRYLAGNILTEADVRLFTTLIRFDMVYVGHFKCNKKRIVDYPNIWGYTREIYQMKGIADTVDFEHITKHYMVSHKKINPFGIVSIGPDMDLNQPHGRDKL